LLSSWSPTARAETLDHIVAIVNDSVITQSQLAQKMQFAHQEIQASGANGMAETALRTKVLQQMIDNELEMQIAKKMGINVSDAEVSAAITTIAKRNGFDLSQFQTKLQESGISYVAYRKQIYDQILISQVAERQVGNKIVITDKEINSLAHKLHNQPLKAENTQYHCEDLVVPLAEKATAEQIAIAKQQAQALLQQARNGKGFQELIQTALPKDSLSGGDLGWRPLSGLPEIFIALVPKMHAGEISNPVLAPNGWHLIKLIEVKGEQSEAPQTLFSTHVRHILIKTTPLANDVQVRQRLLEIRSDIQRGGDFGKLARQYSQDPGSAGKDGDLGWMDSGMLDPQFENAMNQLKPGQISEPIKTPFGWHLIEVLGRKTIQNNQPYLKNQARQMLYEQKQQEAVKDWLKQLRKQSYIKIME
jgi:peptidyl-prolyl cis-trans isomerase SurA